MRLIPRLPFRLTLPRVVVGVYAAVAWTLWYSLPTKPSLTLDCQTASRVQAFSTDGQLIVTAKPRIEGQFLGSAPKGWFGVGLLRVWNRSTGEELASIDCRGQDRYFQALADDGLWLLTTHETGDERADMTKYTLDRWDFRGNNSSIELPIRKDEDVGGLENGRFWVRETDETSFRLSLLDPVTGQRELVYSKSNVTGRDKYVAILPSRDRRYWATYTIEPKPCVHVSNDRGVHWKSLEPPGVELIKDVFMYPDHSLLAYSADGTTIGLIARTTGSQSSSADELQYSAVWDLESGKLKSSQVHELHVPETDGNCSWESRLLWDFEKGSGRLRLFDPTTDAERLDITVRGTPDRFRMLTTKGITWALKPSPDDRTLAVVEWDRYGAATTGWPWLDSKLSKSTLENWYSRSLLTLYDVPDKKRVGQIRNQRFEALSPDGRTLATSSFDQTTISLWDLPLRRPWLAIFGWSALPAGFVGVIGLWSRRRNRTAD